MELFGYNINKNEISKEEENDNSEASFRKKLKKIIYKLRILIYFSNHTKMNY